MDRCSGDHRNRSVKADGAGPDNRPWDRGAFCRSYRFPCFRQDRRSHTPPVCFIPFVVRFRVLRESGVRVTFSPSHVHRRPPPARPTEHVLTVPFIVIIIICIPFIVIVAIIITFIVIVAIDFSFTTGVSPFSQHFNTVIRHPACKKPNGDLSFQPLHTIYHTVKNNRIKNHQTYQCTRPTGCANRVENETSENGVR